MASLYLSLRETSLSKHSFIAQKNYIQILSGHKKLDDKVREHLSPDQWSSLTLLLQWWAARKENQNTELEAKAAELRILKFQAPKQTQYHDVLAKLQNLELQKGHEPLRLGFGRRSTDNKLLETAALSALRHDAACYTACRRLSISYYKFLIQTPLQNHLKKCQPEGEHRPPFGASLVPLIPQLPGVPFYLWDSHEKRVRTVSDIMAVRSQFPVYVAISHTWGRWQNEIAPWIQLPGVPWQIPQISKFNVEKLPDMLSALPWRYVWLDLLTIPQGMTLPEDLQTLQQKEIQYTPSIFRGADKAIIWLDDVPSWSSLPATVIYLCLSFLSNSPGREFDEKILSSALTATSAAASVPSELLNHPKNRTVPEKDQWEPNGWFYSLWALQEAIIRPDMLIYNASWEPLEISKGVPVALNDIAALVKANIASQKVLKIEQPLGVLEIVQLFVQVGLLQLLDLTLQSSVTADIRVGGGSSGSRSYGRIVPCGGINPHERKVWKEGNPGPQPT